jgi:hypothetical protein
LRSERRRSRLGLRPGLGLSPFARGAEDGQEHFGVGRPSVASLVATFRLDGPTCFAAILARGRLIMEIGRFVVFFFFTRMIVPIACRTAPGT